MNSTENFYKFLFTDLADPRTNHWFLIDDPIPGLAILGLYLYFVLKLGPEYMRDRKPFKLKSTLVAYNFLQVVFSIYMLYEVSTFLQCVTQY